MTKEQEKAIEYTKNLIETIKQSQILFNEPITARLSMITYDYFKTILNLIQTQQEEIEKKDKTINEMAKQLYILGFCKELKCKECNADKFEECIKQYFERKIENE